MKLQQWMTDNETDDAAMATLTGTDRTTISRIRRALNRPSWDLALRIVDVTKREVTLDDLAMPMNSGAEANQNHAAAE